MIKFLAILVTILSYISPSWGADIDSPSKIDIHGAANLEHIRSNNITIDGPAYLSFVKNKLMTINGPTNLNMVKSESILINGTLDFNNLEVSKLSQVNGVVKGSKGSFADLKIDGNLTLSSSDCQILTVNGLTVLDHSNIKGKTTINGKLEAADSKLQDVQVTANKIVFNNSIAENVTMIAKKDNEEQIIYLKGKSKIIGKINFSAGNGKVILSYESETPQTIKGGMLQRE